MSLIGNALKPLAKSVLIPLGLTAVGSATDASIHKKIFGSSTTTLIISNEEMNDIMKTIKSLEEFGLLTKGVSETMLSYSLKCRKNTGNKNPEVVKTKGGRIMLLSKCAVCNSKKSKFLKEQEAERLWDIFKHSPNPFTKW